MKKFVIFAIILVFIVLSQKIMFSKIYASKTDKEVAQLIENAVDLISRDIVSDYNMEFTIPDISYVCFAGSIYSRSANEILKEVYPDYKYSTYLELKKQHGRGEGSSILMLISKDSLIPIFFSASFFDINFSGSLKKLKEMDCCRVPLNKNVKIDIKKQNAPRQIWDSLYEKFEYDKAIITIK